MKNIMNYSYNPDNQQLTFVHEEMLHYSWQTSFTGRLIRKTYKLRPHAQGLIFEIEDEGRTRKYQKEVLPGEYSLEVISEYIQSKLIGLGYGTPKTFVSDILLETEIWFSRGFMNNSNFPELLLQKIPLRTFVKGSLKNYHQWMRSVVYKERIFDSLGRDKVEQNIKNGSFPERLHSIKKWKYLDFEDMLSAIASKAWKDSHWGVFVTQYFTFYARVLRGHKEAWNEFHIFAKACLALPKITIIRDLFNDIYAYGGTLSKRNVTSSIRTLGAYRNALLERYDQIDTHTILRDYVIPKITPPTGWQIATKHSFWNLGELYSCCINTNGNYSRALSENTGLIAYRPDFSSKKDTGALAFYSLHGNSWRLDEFRGYSNCKPDETYISDSVEICAILNRDLEKQQEKQRKNAKKY